MKAQPSVDLQLHSKRLRNGFFLAATLLLISAVASYFVLQAAQKRQTLIESLLITVSDLRLEIRDSFEHTTDLKEAIATDGTSPRLLAKIRQRLEVDHLEINALHTSFEVTLQQILERGGSPELQTVYSEKPYDVQRNLHEQHRRITTLLHTEIESLKGQFSRWLPVDAVGAAAGNLLGGLDRIHHLLVAESENNAHRLNRFQTMAFFTILGVVIASTIFIFVPLMRGLRRAHATMESNARELQHHAFFDSDTGLLNELGLSKRAKRADSSVIVAVFHIGNPAVIAQMCGLDNTVVLYRQLSRKLSTLLPNAQLGRTGDNEFMAVVECEEADFNDTDWEYFRRALSEGYTVNNKIVSPEISIGVTTSSKQDADIDKLMVDARLALLYCKKDTRISSFNQDMRERSESENAIIEDIRRAVGNAEFVPFYQLKIDAASRKPCGMEALCRWRKPDGTLISPGVFIPPAEASGLIVEITWLMLKQIAIDISRWKMEGILPGRVAFNAAADCLHEQEFVEKLVLINREVSNNPDDVFFDVEVTENVEIAGENDFYTSVLANLRSSGFRIAMDDFGTGFNSLNAVIGLEIDAIKIDQSFVRRMFEDAASLVVVETVVKIAEVMGITCVAEGVETQEQATRLTEMGCHQLQGFFFHKPAAFDEVTDYLRQSGSLQEAA